MLSNNSTKNFSSCHQISVANNLQKSKMTALSENKFLLPICNEMIILTPKPTGCLDLVIGDIMDGWTTITLATMTYIWTPELPIIYC